MSDRKLIGERILRRPDNGETFGEIVEISMEEDDESVFDYDRIHPDGRRQYVDTFPSYDEARDKAEGDYVKDL